MEKNGRHDRDGSSNAGSGVLTKYFSSNFVFSDPERESLMHMDEALERKLFADDAQAKKEMLEARGKAILSSKIDVSCEHCHEDSDSLTKQRETGSYREKCGKEKKQKRCGGAIGVAAKEEAKPEKNHVWVCLECSRHFCGGADTEPHGHVRAHCYENQHWWAAKYDDPTLMYCFKCREEVSLKIPDFSPLTKKDTDKLQTALASDASVELKETELVDWRSSSDSDWDDEATTTTKPVEGKESINSVPVQSLTLDQMENSTSEESQLNDISMKPRTGAPVKQRTNSVAQRDNAVTQKFGVFLDRFTLPGDERPYYHCELVTMVKRGFGSRELNIHYSHLLGYSKGLAMEVCNTYERLRANLKETARMFVQKLMTTESNLTETARKHMQQLASMESAQSLELKFLEMPKVEKPIRTPLPDKCALVQRLLADMLSKHRSGLSWEGDFTHDDMEVCDDKVVITKIPKSFQIHPQISHEMITEMEKDFDRIAQSVLQKFDCPRSSIVYLKTYYNMLSCMRSHAAWWSNRITTKALRELIEHHPFLKPSMARTNLWSGIFSACISYDRGDETMLFKRILEKNLTTNSWVGEVKKAKNRMLKSVFHCKDQKPGIQKALGPITESTTKTEATIGHSEYLEYYDEASKFLFEYLSDLSQQGSECSFQSRMLTECENGRRKQVMKSLDETEVAGAVLLEEQVMEALTGLLGSSAMTGMLESVWEFYKSSNNSHQA
uniref:UBP-type domain-containing protein n=1 Tax=Leersia perrieri TaxID=77586 RepID=A0A0D9WN74_9ORYZ